MRRVLKYVVAIVVAAWAASAVGNVPLRALFIRYGLPIDAPTLMVVAANLTDRGIFWLDSNPAVVLLLAPAIIVAAFWRNPYERG